MATTPNRGYQLPAPGSKLKDDVLRLIAALGAIDTDVANLLLALVDKSNVGHGHAMAEITGLVAALGNKLDVGYHDALANLTDVDVAGVANGMALLRQASKWIPVALQINNIAGLETALNGKATPADITAAINALVAAAPGALDTLNELATALGNDPDFAATVSSALGNRVRVDAAQAFTAVQKGQARANIEAGILAGFRNKLINGNFDIWQRGTGPFTALGGLYTADRWRVGGGGSGAAGSVTRGAYSPSDTDMRYALGIQQTGGSSSIYAFQRIEDVRTLAGKRATLTVWARNDGNNPNIGARIDQNFGSGGSATVVGTRQDKAISGTHTRYDFVFDIPSVVGKTIGANSFLEVYIFNAVGVNTLPSMLYIGRISLVEGDATAEADPFSPRHIQQEEALCQRYYERGSGFTVRNGSASAEFTSIIVQYRVTKRGSTTSTVQVGAIDGQTTEGFRAYQVATAAGADYSTGIWTSDAEL